MTQKPDQQIETWLEKSYIPDFENLIYLFKIITLPILYHNDYYIICINYLDIESLGKDYRFKKVDQDNSKDDRWFI